MASHGTPPMITEVLRTPLPLPSCPLMADSAIPKAVSPIHDLRAREFDIMTPIEVQVRPQGAVRRSLALHSSGTLEWPASGFRDDRQRGTMDMHLAGLIAFAGVCAALLLGWLP